MFCVLVICFFVCFVVVLVFSFVLLNVSLVMLCSFVVGVSFISFVLVAVVVFLFGSFG